LSCRKITLLLTGLYLCGLITFPLIVYAESAPGFTLPADSGQVTLADLHGKVVYLDFWATWCVPCRKSFPWFNDVLARYKDKGFVIVAVNLDKDKSDVRKFLEKYPADFSVAYDPDGEVAVKYQVKVMPSSYLIDRNGEIQLSHGGFREKDKPKLESAIKSLLEQ